MNYNNNTSTTNKKYKSVSGSEYDKDTINDKAIQYPYSESFLKSYTFYLPANLDLRSLLISSGSDYWLRHIWKLYYILTLIYKGRWSKAHDDFALINIKTLRRVVGDKFASKALYLLRRLEIINTDNRYITGKKSRGYRFAPRYNTAFKPVGTKNSESIPEPALHRVPRVKLKTPEHEYLFGILQGVTFHESVNEFWASFKPESIDQEDYYKRSVEFIQNKDWFFSYDDVTGRVFNNITSLPKELRKYLLLDGQPLIEIDVANCQPLLMTSFYRDDEQEEREAFQATVENGDFYETLNMLLKTRYPSRDKVKDAVYMRILFGSLKQKRYKLNKEFAAKFPILDAKITDIKTPNYEQFSVELQKLEADIMINGVVRKVASSAHFPVLTIHDSAITLPKHEKELRQIMENEFCNKLGVIPVLRNKSVEEQGKDELAIAA